MYKDQALGVVILLVALAVIGVYGYMLLLGKDWQLIALLIVGTIAVVGIMGIIAWIGWTMATTPAPEPIETSEVKTTSEAVPAEEKKEEQKE